MLDFATTLHLQEPERLVQYRIDRYFKQHGYETKRDKNGAVSYERGSKWYAYFGDNPAKWHASATISIESPDEDSSTVDVRLRVNTQGQLLVIQRERNVWQTEFDVMTSYLETGKIKKGNIVGDLGRMNEIKNTNVILFLVFIAPMGLFVVGIAILVLLSKLAA